MIKHNGVEISQYVISVTASQSLCEGTATMNILLAANYPYNIFIWDTFEIEGMPSFYVNSFSKELPDYTIKLNCQDATKRLTDYYVSENYQVTQGQTNYYWLDKILAEIGITYNITDDYYISYLNPEAQVGMSTAMDIIVPLVQQGGCFFYVDTNNVLQIKKVNKGDPVRTFVDTEILNIETSENDKMLRNRIVVRGKGNPVSGVWVQAEKTVQTPYNYDEKDIRTSVMYNSSIAEQGLANSLAKRLSDELKKITFITTIEVPGTYSVSIGDTIFLNSKYRIGECLVTTKSVSYSSNGIITTFVLDERCARILGIYGSDGYVYIGTQNAGIWRKPLKTNHVWENFSTGLEESYVRYLDIAHGVFVTILGNGHAFFRNIGLTSWGMLEPGDLVDEENEIYTQGTYPETIGEDGYYYAAGSCIDKTTGEIYVTYTTKKPSDERGYMYAEYVTYEHTWLCKFGPSGNLLSTEIVRIGGNTSFHNVNIQSDGKDIYGIYATPQWMDYENTVNNIVLDGFFSNLDKDGVSYSPAGGWASSKLPHIHEFKVYDCVYLGPYDLIPKWKFVIFDAVTGQFTYSPEFSTTLPMYTPDGNGMIDQRVLYSLIVFYREEDNCVYTVFRGDDQVYEVWKYDITNNTVSYVRTLSGSITYNSFSKFGYYLVSYLDEFGELRYRAIDIVTGDVLDNDYKDDIIGITYKRVGKIIFLHAVFKIYDKKNFTYAVNIEKSTPVALLSTEDDIYMQLSRGASLDVINKRMVDECCYFFSDDEKNTPRGFRAALDFLGNLTVIPSDTFGGNIYYNGWLNNFGENRFCGIHSITYKIYNYIPTDKSIYDLKNIPASLARAGSICLDFFDNDIYIVTPHTDARSKLGRLDKNTFEMKSYNPPFNLVFFKISAMWGNVLCIRGDGTGYPGSPEYIVYGAKEDFDYQILLHSYLLLKKDKEQFTNVHGFPSPYTVEINQDSVISLYDEGGHGVIYDTVEKSITGIDNLFVRDMRYFNTASGIDGFSGLSYFLIGAQEGNMLVERDTFDAHQYSMIETIKCETTNNGDIPYMFTASWGHFYQRDGQTFPAMANPDFIVRDENRPNSTITVIRCDDEL